VSQHRRHLLSSAPPRSTPPLSLGGHAPSDLPGPFPQCTSGDNDDATACTDGGVLTPPPTVRLPLSPWCGVPSLVGAA
jgi:hypothetical protein